MKTLVVNLFAGPGAGKTTCAWEIAAELKKLGVHTEYVPEYAKELVWDEDYKPWLIRSLYLRYSVTASTA